MWYEVSMSLLLSSMTLAMVSSALVRFLISSKRRASALCLAVSCKSKVCFITIATNMMFKQRVARDR